MSAVKQGGFMDVLLTSNHKDDDLEQGIARALQGKVACLNVVVKDGYVNLSGNVDHPAAKKAVASLVEGITGVRMLTNHIRFVPW